MYRVADNQVQQTNREEYNTIFAAAEKISGKSRKSSSGALAKREGTRVSLRSTHPGSRYAIIVEQDDCGLRNAEWAREG